jgi:hypothetical protein
VGDLREQAVLDLRRYFKTFSGRRFERFDEGGDRPDVADSFTLADVVAVMMLSIRWTDCSRVNPVVWYISGGPILARMTFVVKSFFRIVGPSPIQTRRTGAIFIASSE